MRAKPTDEKKSTKAVEYSHSPENTTLITQKEYLFTNSKKFTFLGTESVRGCYCVTFFHPAKSGIIHWDDGTKHVEFDRVIQEYLSPDLKPRDCQVNIAGGWSDNTESKKSGIFLQKNLAQYDFQVTTKYYQLTLQDGKSLDNQGFSRILLNTETGVITTSSNWDPSKRIKADYGEYFRQRCYNIAKMDMVNTQMDSFPASGTTLYFRDDYASIQQKEAKAICMAARDDKRQDIIDLIDNGITPVDTLFKSAQEWTALHFACKKGHLDIAKLLIMNGADIAKKNNKGKTPIELLKNLESKAKLGTLGRIAKVQLNESVSHMLTLSLYSRHPEQIDAKNAEQVEKLLSDIEDPEMRKKLDLAISRSTA